MVMEDKKKGQERESGRPLTFFTRRTLIEGNPESHTMERKYTMFAVHSLIPVQKKLTVDMVMTKESGDVDTHTHTHKQALHAFFFKTN